MNFVYVTGEYRIYSSENEFRVLYNWKFSGNSEYTRPLGIESTPFAHWLGIL